MNERMSSREWAQQKRWAKSPASKLYAEAKRARDREQAAQVLAEELACWLTNAFAAIYDPRGGDEGAKHLLKLARDFLGVGAGDALIAPGATHYAADGTSLHLVVDCEDNGCPPVRPRHG